MTIQTLARLQTIKLRIAWHSDFVLTKLMYDYKSDFIMAKLCFCHLSVTVLIAFIFPLQ